MNRCWKKISYCIEALGLRHLFGLQSSAKKLPVNLSSTGKKNTEKLIYIMPFYALHPEEKSTIIYCGSPPLWWELQLSLVLTIDSNRAASPLVAFMDEGSKSIWNLVLLLTLVDNALAGSRLLHSLEWRKCFRDWLLPHQLFGLSLLTLSFQ